MMGGLAGPWAFGVSQQNGSGSPNAARRQDPGPSKHAEALLDERHILPTVRTRELILPLPAKADYGVQICTSSITRGIPRHSGMAAQMHMTA